ncbi:MAG: trimeric intracellular cation channel family protein [Candidatus Eiseniibacteriota bacterium]
MSDTSSVALPALVDLGAVFVSALSGALFAQSKRMDLAGLAGLAIVTGLGGGMIRDVLLQRGLPAALADARYLVTALAGALAVLAFGALVARAARALLVVDALSLGVYGVVGTLKAVSFGLSFVPAVFLGVITAVGGGVLRDALAGEIPAIFKPGELYAVPAVFGCAILVLLLDAGWSQVAAGAAGFVAIVVFRLLSLQFGWRTRAAGASGPGT